MELGIELLNVFFEDVMASRVKPGGIQGAHKDDDEIDDAAGQGILI